MSTIRREVEALQIGDVLAGGWYNGLVVSGLEVPFHGYGRIVELHDTETNTYTGLTAWSRHMFEVQSPLAATR